MAKRRGALLPAALQNAAASAIGLSGNQEILFGLWVLNTEFRLTERGALMTDIKKTKKNTSAAKAKKLQLNKETLKDLSAKKGASPKGGARHVCTWAISGCY